MTVNFYRLWKLKSWIMFSECHIEACSIDTVFFNVFYKKNRPRVSRGDVRSTSGLVLSPFLLLSVAPQHHIDPDGEAQATEEDESSRVDHKKGEEAASLVGRRLGRREHAQKTGDICREAKSAQDITCQHAEDVET